MPLMQNKPTSRGLLQQNTSEWTHSPVFTFKNTSQWTHLSSWQINSDLHQEMDVFVLSEELLRLLYIIILLIKLLRFFVYLCICIEAVLKVKVFVCDVNKCVFEGGRGVGWAVWGLPSSDRPICQPYYAPAILPFNSTYILFFYISHICRYTDVDHWTQKGQTKSVDDGF